MAEVIRCQLLAQKPGFNPHAHHVWFLVYRVALGRFSSDYFNFSLPVTIPSMLHTHELLFQKCVIGLPNQHNVTSSVLIWGFTSYHTLGCIQNKVQFSFLGNKYIQKGLLSERI